MKGALTGLSTRKTNSISSEKCLLHFGRLLMNSVRIVFNAHHNTQHFIQRIPFLLIAFSRNFHATASQTSALNAAVPYVEATRDFSKMTRIVRGFPPEQVVFVGWIPPVGHYNHYFPRDKWLFNLTLVALIDFFVVPTLFNVVIGSN